MSLEDLLVDKDKINLLIGSTELSIVDAMEKIDKNSEGLLFIVDETKKLIGCLTDGDVRRWLLKSGDLHASVTKAMKLKPEFLYEKDKINAKALMEEKVITALPILNLNKEIIDIILLSDSVKYKELSSFHNKLPNVPVVIMAGGKGTRLYPYTKILPKPLIPIGETPILERIIDLFTNYGINKYYISVNYKKGMIRSYFSELNPSYSIEYIEERTPLGTGGSIKLIKEVFQIPIFITNCDTLILADYSDIYAYHKISGNTITIVAALKNIVVPYGVLYIGNNGKLLQMEEKPKHSYFINTGMYIINPDIIKLIPDGVLYHMTDLVRDVMKAGYKVGMYPISEDSFLDMGEFSEMKRMEEKLKIV